jgi:hypothetical protein
METLEVLEFHETFFILPVVKARGGGKEGAIWFVGMTLSSSFIVLLPSFLLIFHLTQ